MAIKSSMKFDELPNEMKLYVFSFLGKTYMKKTASKVCKKWRDLCNDPSLSRNIEIRGRKQNIQEIIHEFNRNNFIVDIVFRKVRYFMFVNFVTKHLSVRRIQFIFCDFTEINIEKFIAIFPNVESINLNRCTGLNTQIISKLMDWKYLKSFEMIDDYDFDKNLPSVYLSVIAEKISRLEELSLANCQVIFSQSFRRLIDLQGINLKYLSVNCVDFCDEDFARLTKTCVNLTHLNLAHASKLTDYGFLMFQNLPCLEFLRIHRTLSMFSRIFAMLFDTAKFTNLKELVIQKCKDFDDDSLLTLVKCCPKLTDLTIRLAERVTRFGVLQLPYFCSDLEYLVLHHVHRVSESHLRETAQWLPNIRYCELKQSHVVSNSKRHLCLVVDNKNQRLYNKKRPCYRN